MLLLKLLNKISVLTFLFIGVAFTLPTSCWGMERDNEGKFLYLPRQYPLKQEIEKENKSSSILFILPKEVLVYIFSFLNPYDLANQSLVSKKWKEVSEEGSLWKSFGVTSKQTYKELYKKENIFQAIKKIIEDNPVFYTHQYIDPYFLPAHRIQGIRHFRLADSQKDFLNDIVFLTLKNIFSSPFMMTSEVLKEIIKCIAIQAFEKNREVEDRNPYISSTLP